MILATIHLNGTSVEVLYEQQIAVSHACRALLRALENAAPNGRDYYPQGDEAFRAAAEQHLQKVRSVEALLADTYTVLEHLADERDRRAK